MKPTVDEEIQAGIEAAPLRLLILEDKAEDAELILFELRTAGVRFAEVLAESREQFVGALANGKFDAVVSDYRVPNWTGLDALDAVKAAGQEAPFLLVTGTLGEEAAVECIKHGVADYILKHRLERLPIALRRAMREKTLKSENERANAALKASERKNQELVRNAAYAIFRSSSDGQLLESNPAFGRILGWRSEEEARALHLSRDVFRFPEQHAQIVGACRAQGQVHGVEAEWRRKDGGLVIVRMHARETTECDELEFIAEDVTELRAMERQLRQAQKFEAIGQLAGGIAHDFNNVVGAILGWAELGFEQSGENGAAADRFARIREQAERAATLTRELLAFARKQVLQPRAVDLNSITSGLINFLDKVIGKDIELKVITAPLDPVKADPTQIEQVLMNLCINARDAMPNGGRMVIETEMAELDEAYCRFYPSSTPGKYAVLSVSDTGTGMDAETRERIFEPFFTTKEQNKGTGMGLATVYGIIKQHGGMIHVYSEPGEGTLFRAYLPAMEGCATGEESKTAAGPSMAETRGTETILIAEDHDSIREMARQTLMNLGYQVFAAGDGEEALRLCAEKRPALAIFDVVMPKMGGLAAASRLSEKYPGVPVVFTSGYSAETHPAAQANSPGQRYLQKPYSPLALGRLVRQTLDESNQAAGLKSNQE